MIKKSRAFFTCPLIFIKNSQSHLTQKDIYVLQNKGSERGHSSLAPLYCLLQVVKPHKPHLPRNTGHDRKVILFALKKRYQSDLQLLLLQPRLPAMTSSYSIK